MKDFRASKRILSFLVKTRHFCLFGSKSKLSTLPNVLYAVCLISYLELSLFELAVFYRIVFMDLYFTQILHIYFYVQAYIFRPVKGVIVSGVVTDRNSSHVGQNFRKAFNLDDVSKMVLDCPFTANAWKSCLFAKTNDQIEVKL